MTEFEYLMKKDDLPCLGDTIICTKDWNGFYTGIKKGQAYKVIEVAQLTAHYGPNVLVEADPDHLLRINLKDFQEYFRYDFKEETTDDLTQEVCTESAASPPVVPLTKVQQFLENLRYLCTIGLRGHLGRKYRPPHQSDALTFSPPGLFSSGPVEISTQMSLPLVYRTGFLPSSYAPVKYLSSY